MLKTLGRETKGFRLVSILTPIFMICEVIMEMIIPKLMASIIDDGVTSVAARYLPTLWGVTLAEGAFTKENEIFAAAYCKGLRLLL